MTGNVIQFRRGSCPITTWTDLAPGKYGRRSRGDRDLRTHRCGEPLAVGAKFCEKHEADRVRLTLAVRRQR